ncbi:bola protein [Cercophora samala]|uniref:Bola protein n=1 Tax=Cercophora samala TaxID=330535 RepID=A0AA39Z003_9PEZI|nr:bola protein [Cercophora samala]
MICRTCLRARLAQRLSQTTSAVPKRTLFAATTRYAPSTTSSAIPARSQRQFPRIATHPQRFYSSESSASASQAPETPSALPRPEDLTEGEAQVWDILVAEFAPTQLLVQDISGGCGSMYGIDISSEKFRGLNMLKQQRMVNAALGDLVKEWHGVQLKTRAP